jgi:hypothetical protein
MVTEPTRKPTLRQRIQSAARALTGSVSVDYNFDKSRGWIPLYDGGPQDRPWADVYLDLMDSLEAWQKNFLIRRVVATMRSYVVGSGITLTSDIAEVNDFIGRFWIHPKTRMPGRLGPMCDELVRAGEIFPTLHTNRADGMSYVRFVPAQQIIQIHTAPNDYETELRYAQQTAEGLEPRWWLGPSHPDAGVRGDDGRLPPVMLHFAINRPLGATRGESDLTPILPWARRYSEWLKDRVRLNRQRTRQAMLDVTVAEDTKVEEKRQQLRRDNPLEYGIYVHGTGEEITLHNLEIDAQDAGEDGRLMRLAVATGASLAMHYMGEGDRINYATAKEMGEPTARFLTDRQADFCQILVALVAAAYNRFQLHRGDEPAPAEALQIRAQVPEVARADNESLARAGRDAATALQLLKLEGWIDDRTAASLALKFLGETQ